jgi:hypothetical protein
MGALEPTKLCFLQLTAGRKAPEHCSGEETNCVSTKVLVVHFALLLAGSIKQSGTTLDSILPLKMYFKNCQCTLPVDKIMVCT